MRRWYLYLAALITLAVLCGCIWSFRAAPPAPGEELSPEAMHFALLLQENREQNELVRSALDALTKEYAVALEVHSFTSPAEQRQMLRILSRTDVDGVVLWPVSGSDEEYIPILEDLRQREIPVVVIERDVADGYRNCYIGSGASSDYLVLRLWLSHLAPGSRIVIGNRSGSGTGQSVELAVFRPRREGGAPAQEAIRGRKLRQIGELLREDYVLDSYTCLEGEDARPLQIKYTLVQLFAGEQRPALFFSLESELSAAAASAMTIAVEGSGEPVELLCYGALEDHRENLERGVVDGLLTPRPAVSAVLGVRYLRDICRDFWVPDRMDSGISFLDAAEYRARLQETS